MIRSANQVEYVLSQPMEFPPGQVWKYNGGTTQLLAAIIEKTTGKKIEQFAKEYLFQPLGITSFEWIKYDGTDLAAAASGLRLRSRDLLKFGLMYYKIGVWQGHRRSSDPKWVEESFQPHVQQTMGWLVWIPVLALARHDQKQDNSFCLLRWKWRSKNNF